MANADNPFGLSEGAKMALEQTHQAMDTYFDFLKKSISAFPSSGTEIGDRWKEQSLLNLTAFQELAKRLSTASSLEEALKFRRHSCTRNEIDWASRLRASGRRIRKRLTMQIKSARRNRLIRWRLEIVYAPFLSTRSW
jgi:hypothetical protein